MEKLKNKNYNSIIFLAVFIFIELFLYSYIHLWGFWGDNYVRYFSIVLCCLFVFLNIKKFKNNYLICLALLFTVFADFFITVLKMHLELAMIMFNIAQLFYMAYTFTFTKNRKLKIANVISRIVLITLFQTITTFVMKQNLNALVVISIFYFCNLIINMIFCLPYFKKCKFLTLGLILFLFCDICIAIETFNNLMGYYNYMVIAGISLVWVFYLPSQTFIALHTFNYKTPLFETADNLDNVFSAV